MKRFLITLQVAAIVFTSLFFTSCGDGTQSAVSDTPSVISEAVLPSEETSQESSDGIYSEPESEAEASAASSANMQSVSSASAADSTSAAKKSPGNSNSGTDTAVKSGGMNIMAIGSSNIYRYFVPAVLYEKYGVYSQVVADASTSGKMIKYYIAEGEKRYDPDLFVVELRWFIKKQVQPIRNKRNLNNAYRDVVKIKTASIRTSAAVEMLNIGLTGDNLLSAAELKQSNPKWFDTSNCTGLFDGSDKLNGYRIAAGYKKLAAVNYSGVTAKKAFSAATEADLRALLEYCKENKLNVLFTLSPYAMTESDMMLHNEAASIVKSYGFKLFDANKKLDAIGINYSTDFYNKWHTNACGAKKYTEYLGKYIKSNYKLKSSVSAKQKQSLNEGLANYKERYASALAKLEKKWK